MLRHFNLILLGSLAGFLVHFYLIYSANYEYEEIKIVGIMLSLTTWIALSYIMYFTTIVIRRFLLKSEMIGLRLLLEIISFAVIAFFAVSLLYTMSESLFVVHNNENTWINGNYTKIGIVTFIICVIYAVILIALDSFQVYSENKLNFIAIQREHIDLQMAALKSHLSPHFLFNGLNTISSLIYTDKKKAEKYIRNLFSTYNYALTKYDNNTVTIQEELELVLAYLEMVNVRFGDSVNFINKIEQKYYQARVLPLSIQTLVENALKHNQADVHNLLTITLTLESVIS